ncbi:MAG: amidase [Saprospiraceae bacterium]
MGAKYFSAIFFLLISAACSHYRHPAFSRRDVAAAQRVIGMDFSRAHIDTMYRYLGDNLNGYDSMQPFELDYRVAPALYFDPRPEGFEMPLPGPPSEWGLSEVPALPDDLESLAFFPVSKLSALIRGRKLTAEALTRIYLNRIARYDPMLHSVVTLMAARALDQARRADEAIAEGRYLGPLHGIPYVVKDLMALPDYPTTWGARPYQAQLLDHTASVIERLDSAGAILLAKVSSGSLARGDVWFGGRTNNPWDTLQGASGSSAGSAAALAAGLCAFSIGTETLGSIVAPSARCGVTGLRPTFGRVSRAGVMTLSWSMDKVGPICRDALDCALVLDVIRGKDKKDRCAVDAPFNFRAGRDVSTLKVGYVRQVFEKDSSGAGANNLEALEVFRRMGISLKEVQLPADFPFAAFDAILRAESGAFFDELIRSGKVDDLEEQHSGSRANSLRQSRFIPAAEYLQANRHRTLLIEKMHDVMQDFDVVLVPPGGSRQNLITNLTGHPALVLPTGLDEKGRPSSITLLGNLYGEGPILELGASFQAITAFNTLQPPLFSVKKK